MTALKASIVIMGVLIVACLIVVGATLYNRAVDGAATAARTNSPDAPEAPAKPFGTVELDLPAGATVENTRTAGRRLILTLAVPKTGQWVYIIHLDTGAVLGKIRVNAATVQ